MGNRILALGIILLAVGAFLLAPNDAQVMAAGFMLCVVFGELRQFKGAGNG